MKRFIIFFNEREGTSAFVKLLDNFKRISIIRQVNNEVWEPFDRHSCGNITPQNIKKLFKLLFDENPLDYKQINDIYTKTAKLPIVPFDKNNIVGFKMRFYNAIYLPYPKIVRMMLLGIPSSGNFLRKKHEELIFEILKSLNIVVFIAVRQDVFRKALSKYHGDGKSIGKGHLQFDITSGTLKIEDLPKIFVYPHLLEKYIAISKEEINMQRLLFKKLKNKKIDVFPLLYEDFLFDKVNCIKSFFKKFDHFISDEEIERVLSKGNTLKKVHSFDISEFVINADELIKKYGHEYVKW